MPRDAGLCGELVVNSRALRVALMIYAGIYTRPPREEGERKIDFADRRFYDSNARETWSRASVVVNDSGYLWEIICPVAPKRASS